MKDLPFKFRIRLVIDHDLVVQHGLQRGVDPEALARCLDLRLHLDAEDIAACAVAVASDKHPVAGYSLVEDGTEAEKGGRRARIPDSVDKHPGLYGSTAKTERFPEAV